MKRYLVYLIVALLAACSEAPAPVTSPSEPPSSPDDIILIEHRTILLTQKGETYQLDLPDGDIDYVSTKPDVVSVSAVGLITALADLGSASIEVTTKTKTERFSVLIAKPQSDVVLLGETDVVHKGVTGVTLSSALQDRINVGSVLVSAPEGNVAGRVERITVNDAGLLVSLADVSPVDVFEDLRLDVTLSPVAISPSAESQLNSQASLLGFECKLGHRYFRVEFAGLSIQERYLLTPHIVYEIDDGVVSHFELSLGVEAGFEAVLGKLKAAVSSQTEVKCAAKAAPKTLLFVPIYGLVGVGLTATPKIGMDLIVIFEAAQLEVAGPTVKVDLKGTYGLGFDESGLYTLDETAVSEGEISWGGVEGTTKVQSEVDLKPYLALTFGVAPMVAKETVDAAVVHFLEAKAYAEIEQKISLLVDKLDDDYRGPELNEYVGFEVNLNPLLKDKETLTSLLEKTFLDAAAIDALVDLPTGVVLKTKLFEAKAKIGQSPAVLLNPDTTGGEVGEVIQVEVSTSDDENRKVALWINPADGEARLLQEGFMRNGKAVFDVALEKSMLGTHALQAFVYAPLYERVDLPYPSKNITLEVRCTDPCTQPEPPAGCNKLSCAPLGTSYTATLEKAYDYTTPPLSPYLVEEKRVERGWLVEVNGIRGFDAETTITKTNSDGSVSEVVIEDSLAYSAEHCVGPGEFYIPTISPPYTRVDEFADGSVTTTIHATGYAQTPFFWHKGAEILDDYADRCP